MVQFVARASQRPCHYATSLLMLPVSTTQKLLLNQLLTDFNKSIRARFNSLLRGQFDRVSIPFDTPEYLPIVPYEMPYKALINGWSYKDLVGRPISPKMLKTSAIWPVKFSDRVDRYHISLTPIITFKNEVAVAQYSREFAKAIGEYQQIHPNPVVFNIDLQSYPQVFTRYDYSRFFLVMKLSQESSKTLMPLVNRLNAILDTVPGEVLGQDEHGRVADLHVTIGMCAGPSVFEQNHPFSMYELYYMNKVLLQPLDKLVEYKVVDKSWNNLRMSLTRDEIRALEFQTNEISLVTNHSQIITKI